MRPNSSAAVDRGKVTSPSFRITGSERLNTVVSSRTNGDSANINTECPLTRAVAGGISRDLGGRTTLSELADVLDRSDAVVVANTGPAHLAAAVGTRVVSLFAPTVPAARWAPYGVPLELLGDQQAPCRGTRATRCPVPGHPCLSTVRPDDVLAALDRLSAVAA